MKDGSEQESGSGSGRLLLGYCNSLYNSGLDSLCSYLPISLDHALFNGRYCKAQF